MPSIFHEPVLEFAVAMQQRSTQQHANLPNDVVRDALFVLVHDTVCTFRALALLADAGWPGPGAALARTLMDEGVSGIAIANSCSPPMAAFRYLYTGLRRHQRDQAFSSAERRAMFDQIRHRLAMFVPEHRKEAMTVLRERDRPYWFNPEFKNPADVLERFAAPGVRWVYAQLSGAAHGTFFGMRTFREDPDAISINAEKPGRKALSLDFLGCRLLLELLLVRDTVERLGMASEVRALMERVSVAANAIK